MINVESLRYTYPGTDKPILEDINLQIKPGEFVLVRGSSGSGKTTLLYCLNGLIPHVFPGISHGLINIDGLIPRDVPLQVMARTVGTVFQNPESQIFMMRVEDDVAFGCENLCLPKEEIINRRNEAMQFMGLWDMRLRETFKLSGGYKQRLAVSSIYAMQPRIFLFDEPTTDMDGNGRREFFKIVQALKNEGKTIILVEHHDEPFLPLADRVIDLEDGRIKAQHQKERIPPPKRKEEQRSMLPVIEMRHVAFDYDRGINVLDDIDISIRQGEIVALCGNNGCGKTTLLKIMAGLLQPRQGNIFILKMNNPTLENLVGRVGFLFQNPDEQLFAATVEEEISFGAKFLGKDINVSDYLRIAGLENSRLRHPQTISRGQRQILAVVSIMAMEPDMVVLDEPTTGLDGKAWHKLMSLLYDYADRGGTIIFSTHNDKASALADRTIIMNEGRVISNEVSG